MQRYQCHKIVEAAKILAIERLVDNSVQLELDDHAIIQKDGQWWPRLRAFVGRRMQGDCGYFVRYEDGYESWSPTTVFEDGYTLILEATEPVPITVVQKAKAQGLALVTADVVVGVLGIKDLRPELIGPLTVKFIEAIQWGELQGRPPEKQPAPAAGEG